MERTAGIANLFIKTRLRFFALVGCVFPRTSSVNAVDQASDDQQGRPWEAIDDSRRKFIGDSEATSAIW